MEGEWRSGKAQRRVGLWQKDEQVRRGEEGRRTLRKIISIISITTIMAEVHLLRKGSVLLGFINVLL